MSVKRIRAFLMKAPADRSSLEVPALIDEATLPQEYQVDARTEDQAVMAISHRTYPIYGVQFHPEAVLTQYGHELLENFHCICQQWQQERTEVC